MGLRDRAFKKEMDRYGFGEKPKPMQEQRTAWNQRFADAVNSLAAPTVGFLRGYGDKIYDAFTAKQQASETGRSRELAAVRVPALALLGAVALAAVTSGSQEREVLKGAGMDTVDSYGQLADIQRQGVEKAQQAPRPWDDAGGARPQMDTFQVDNTVAAAPQLDAQQELTVYPESPVDQYAQSMQVEVPPAYAPTAQPQESMQPAVETSYPSESYLASADTQIETKRGEKAAYISPEARTEKVELQPTALDRRQPTTGEQIAYAEAPTIQEEIVDPKERIEAMRQRQERQRQLQERLKAAQAQLEQSAVQAQPESESEASTEAA